MQDALELRAFGHVVVPIAVVIAMGVARIVSALGDYIRHHDRIEFALGHSLWSVVVFLLQVGLWWIVWSLREVQSADWSFFILIFMLIGPGLLFLATSLLFPSVPDEGSLQLASQFERIGRAFFLCLVGFVIWIGTMEVWLLDEPFIQKTRMLQLLAASLFAVGAVWPTRRVVSVLGLVISTALVIVLATIRARLM